MASELLCHEEFLTFMSPKSVEKEEKLKHSNEQYEIVKAPVRAINDLKLLKDERVLQNLLNLEELCLPSSPDYLRIGQPDLNPSMRKIVTEWMKEVCVECECTTDVFLLAVNLLDRFLAKVHNVPKVRLQLIGSVCLLISSKFKETVPISGEKLIYYTDNSIRAEEIRVSKINRFLSL